MNIKPSRIPNYSTLSPHMTIGASIVMRKSVKKNVVNVSQSISVTKTAREKPGKSTRNIVEGIYSGLV